MDLRFIYFSLLVAAVSGNSFAAEYKGNGSPGAGFEEGSLLSAEKQKRVEAPQLVKGAEQIIGGENPSLPLLGWRTPAPAAEGASQPEPGAIPAGGLRVPTSAARGERFSIVQGGSVDHVEQLSTPEPLKAQEKLPPSLFSDKAAVGQAAPTGKAVISNGEGSGGFPVVVANPVAAAPPVPQASTSVVPEEVVMRIESDEPFAVDHVISGTTMVGLENRSVPGAENQRLVPVTQFLKLDLDKINSNNLSFHLYGWGRGDVADKSFIGKSPEANIAYGYLRYRLAGGNGELRAGRFTIFDGGIVEQLNGVAARGDLLKDGALAVSLFGGSPVKPPAADNRGSLLVGGRTSYRVPGYFEGGIYFVHESGLASGPDSDLKNTRQLVGADICLTPYRAVNFTGHSTYNMTTAKASEHSYLLTIRPTASLLVGAEYSLTDLKEYFSSSSIRSLFSPNTTERFAGYGAKITYTISAPLELSLDLKDLQRDSRKDSYRYGAELRLNLPELRTNYGISWHRLYAGKLQSGFENLPITSYNELRGYVLYNYLKFSASLDVMADLYDSELDSQRLSYLGIASAGYAITPGLGVAGDLMYESNPVVGKEVRALLRLTFNYAAPNFTRSTQGVGK